MAQTPRTHKRVRDPQNPGQLVNAVPVPVVDGGMDATVALQLEDGAKIVVTLRVLEISRIDDRKDAQGRPIYNIDTQGDIRIDYPPEERQ